MNKCPKCQGALVFEGEAAAPGIGSFWSCVLCKTVFREARGHFYDCAKIDDPTIFDLTAADVA